MRVIFFTVPAILLYAWFCVAAPGKSSLKPSARRPPESRVIPSDNEDYVWVCSAVRKDSVKADAAVQAFPVGEPIPTDETPQDPLEGIPDEPPTAQAVPVIASAATPEFGAVAFRPTNFDRPEGPQDGTLAFGGATSPDTEEEERTADDRTSKLAQDVRESAIEEGPPVDEAARPDAIVEEAPAGISQEESPADVDAAPSTEPKPEDIAKEPAPTPPVEDEGDLEPDGTESTPEQGNKELSPDADEPTKSSTETEPGDESSTPSTLKDGPVGDEGEAGNDAADPPQPQRRDRAESDDQAAYPELPEDLSAVPDLVIHLPTDGSDWRAIDKKLGIVTTAYTIDGRRPTVYFQWDATGQVRQIETLDRKAFSNRCRDRNRIDNFRKQLADAKRRFAIDRPMRVVGLVPAEVDLRFAAAQMKAIERRGLDPQTVARTEAHYDLSEGNMYAIGIDRIILSNGNAVQGSHATPTGERRLTDAGLRESDRPAVE